MDLKNNKFFKNQMSFQRKMDFFVLVIMLQSGRNKRRWKKIRCSSLDVLVQSCGTFYEVLNKSFIPIMNNVPFFLVTAVLQKFF